MKNNGGKVLLYIQWFRSLLPFISLYYLGISEYQSGATPQHESSGKNN